MFHFRIGQSGLAHRAPVYQSVAPVDITFFIQSHEKFLYGFAATFIHGESLLGPIARISQSAALFSNGTSKLSLPLPNSFQKLFSTQIFLFQPLFSSYLLLYFDLCSYGSMIGSRNPKSFKSVHPFKSDYYVLQRLIQSVSHVKLPRYIRRRHYDGKRLFLFVDISFETSAALPVLIYFSLKFTGIVVFFQIIFHTHLYQLLFSIIITAESHNKKTALTKGRIHSAVPPLFRIYPI